MGTDPEMEGGFEIGRGGFDRANLLERDGSFGGGNHAMRSRVLDRTPSASLVPEATRSFLQSRVDHQDFVVWQEGGGEEEEQAEHIGDSVNAGPAGKKYDHPTICGIDKRPFFPTVLIVSLLWSMSMTWLQSLVIQDLFGSSVRCTTFFLLMYTMTIGAALHTSLSNPGLMSEELYRRWQDGHVSLPRRAHKHWLYRRPVLRFHQYCRWITNCVGLQNHRSYMVMLAGFVTVAVTDTIIDLLLVPVHLVRGTWTSEFLCLIHLLYSAYFAWYATPLLRQHAGFVMRNEMTQEWKRDDFYVITRPHGGRQPVTELDTEEYNELFDDFEYDETRNPFDKGWVHNCLVFWTHPRGEDELGEF